ncbi:MAG: chorismate--pyruvate lyase [Lachnospiraceae bacterium]|nr:chorismate--pyruvate lyase [Lachnospiraceae bacterium]
MNFETMYFVVEEIDGDYAHLKRTDKEAADLLLVARALLPDSIKEGTELKYEMLQYSIVK